MQVLQQARPRISVRSPVTLPQTELVMRKTRVFQPGTKPEVMLTGVQLAKAKPAGRKFPGGPPFSRMSPLSSPDQRPVRAAWLVEQRKKRLV